MLTYIMGINLQRFYPSFFLSYFLSVTRSNLRQSEQYSLDILNYLITVFAQLLSKFCSRVHIMSVITQIGVVTYWFVVFLGTSSFSICFVLALNTRRPQDVVHLQGIYYSKTIFKYSDEKNLPNEAGIEVGLSRGRPTNKAADTC